MIKESYVSFETARMLKEAGFEAECGSIVDDDGRKLYRPTQALAARWLREVHRIVVDATFIPPSTDGNAWRYFIGEMDDMVWNGDYVPSDEFYETYEAALEAGLQEAVKLIKK